MRAGHDLADEVERGLEDGDLDRVRELVARFDTEHDPAFAASFFNWLGATHAVELLTALVPVEVALASGIEADWPDRVDADDLAEFDDLVRALSTAMARGPMRSGYGEELVDATRYGRPEPIAADLPLLALISRLGADAPLDTDYRTAADRAALERRAATTSIVGPPFLGPVDAILLDPATLRDADERGLDAILRAATLGPTARDRLAADAAALRVANELVAAVADHGHVGEALRPYLADFAVTHMEDLSYAAVHLTESANEAPGRRQLLALGAGDAFTLLAAALEGDQPAVDTTIVLGTQGYIAEVLTDRLSFQHTGAAGNRSAATLEIGSLTGLVTDAMFRTDTNDAERDQARTDFAFGLLSGATDILLKPLPGGPVVGLAARTFRDAVLADLTPDHIRMTRDELAGTELTTSFALQRAIAAAYYEAAVHALEAPVGIAPAALAEADRIVAAVSAFDARQAPADRFLDPDTFHLLPAVGDADGGRPAEAFDQIARTPPPDLTDLAAVVLPLGADAVAFEAAATTAYRR